MGLFHREPADLPENRLLAALPPADRERVVARTTAVTFDYGDVLYRPNTPIKSVYFPRDGVISMVVIMDDGGTVEVGTVGNEGFTGVPLVLGDDRTTARLYCQVPPCHARRMDADDFREELARGGPFRDLVMRYIQFLYAHTAQSTACNRLHEVPERLARWLLMTQDRMQGNAFPLTQQVMSEMLGVRRPSVTVAAGMLQKAGLIEYRRGKMTVLDRAGLEAASCECYKATRSERDRLLPPET